MQLTLYHLCQILLSYNLCKKFKFKNLRYSWNYFRVINLYDESFEKNELIMSFQITYFQVKKKDFKFTRTYQPSVLSLRKSLSKSGSLSHSYITSTITFLFTCSILKNSPLPLVQLFLFLLSDVRGLHYLHHLNSSLSMCDI